MQARKLSREQLSRQNSRQNSRQSSRNASTTSLNGAAPASAPQTPRAKTPISAMAPTNQFSSERDYENLLKEIDSILYVGGNNITVTPGQSRTDLTSKADNEKPIADKTPHETVQRNDIDVNQQRRTVGLSRQSSVVSAAFLDQLETADPDPSWAVPEDEEREMINWVRAKLGDRIVSPGTRPGEMDHAPSGSDVKSLGKDFRTGVMLLELLQVSLWLTMFPTTVT